MYRFETDVRRFRPSGNHRNCGNSSVELMVLRLLTSWTGQDRRSAQDAGAVVYPLVQDSHDGVQDDGPLVLSGESSSHWIEEDLLGTSHLPLRDIQGFLGFPEELVVEIIAKKLHVQNRSTLPFRSAAQTVFLTIQAKSSAEKGRGTVHRRLEEDPQWFVRVSVARRFLERSVQSWVLFSSASKHSPQHLRDFVRTRLPAGKHY